MPPVIDHFGRTLFELEYMLPNKTYHSSSNPNNYDVNEVFAAIMLPTIILGIFGNSVSIYVYSRRHMRRNTVGFLLLSLSIIDLIVLITALPTFSLYKLRIMPGYKVLGSNHSIFTAFCIAYIYPIGCMAKMMSQYVIILIAVERWLAVCRPLQVQIWCTPKNTKRALMYIIIIAIVFNIPRFLEFGADLKLGVISMKLSNRINNEWYFILYYGIRSIIFDTLLPFSVISVTNIQVIKQLKKSHEERKMLTTLQRKDKKTTTMLLVMVILYATCHTFNTSLKFVNLTFKTYAQFQFPLFKVLHHVSNSLLITYSMSTFFIYLIFSVKYRQVIGAIVSCRNVEELDTSNSRNKNPKKNFTVKSNSSNGYTAIKNV